MKTDLLTSEQAANALGISVLTLYEWLSHSDAGEFQIRGQSVSIEYYQGGRRGQGRIRIAESEVDRLMSLMRVQPKAKRVRQKPVPKLKTQYITVTSGRPDD